MAMFILCLDVNPFRSEWEDQGSGSPSSGVTVPKWYSSTVCLNKCSPLQKLSKHWKAFTESAHEYQLPNWPPLLCSYSPTPSPILLLCFGYFLLDHTACPEYHQSTSIFSHHSKRFWNHLFQEVFPDSLEQWNLLASLPTNHSPQRTSPLFPQNINAATYLLA